MIPAITHPNAITVGFLATALLVVGLVITLIVIGLIVGDGAGTPLARAADLKRLTAPLPPEQPIEQPVYPTRFTAPLDQPAPVPGRHRLQGLDRGTDAQLGRWKQDTVFWTPEMVAEGREPVEGAVSSRNLGPVIYTPDTEGRPE